ncbi:hypothetical protein EMIT0111MI5_10109 [Burkholderia sp. IT-111MI5]
MPDAISRQKATLSSQGIIKNCQKQQPSHTIYSRDVAYLNHFN